MAADRIYGHSPVFLDATEACIGRVYRVGVSSETRCWLQRPRIELHAYRYGGEAHTQEVLASSSAIPKSVAAWAQSLRSHGGYRRTVLEGSKGPIMYEFARKRVTLCQDALPDSPTWRDRSVYRHMLI